MTPRLTLTVKSDALSRLASGHPWIYANELTRPPKTIEPGALVDVQTSRGVWIGRGYYNPRSVIAVRLLSREPLDIDDVFFARAIARAQALRDRVVPGEEAYRAVFGEADGLPGLIVDRYGPVLVTQFLTAGMDRLTGAIVKALIERYRPAAIIGRNDAGSRKLEGLPVEKRLLYGEKPDRAVVARNGLEFEVDVWEGQKTGLFLDQAANYRAIAPWCKGTRVLDTFCYAGAWGLHALRHGAVSVLGLDASEKALATASANASRNGLSERVEYRRVDVFNELRTLLAAGARYELIILDPPAFAKTRKDKAGALRGYKEINRLGMSLLTPGGVLVTCSCSHPIDPATFHEVLVEAARDARRTFRLIARRTQGPDHPIVLGIPETEYLQCVILQDRTERI
ncbi:MAG: class I SAM-dependent rRNA methyltransferase [Nitrospirota bacterium]